ncbi:bifunctional 2-C-methyl-D-erythritol 4-phosphate cytidylyltransferase/2-C-methyl-D-erythritol 2,4-cyclodiphosphate synthase [Curtobacterium pusillum]|uniref:Multifunctional fusion protein n=1 Tax=Curtobacterium pusillum TaxID=69373 RepID=A0AAW3T1A6_9MICO|nr:2-C-methyl-D-erythritol 4-phosphate cytidylyltransferase [Curtobacterium pusillum]MBA8988929.1 2-C-methyl-D-erythritol 4-phosphate cytidylyltransferase/2-C-methyl-D-erythritol 2,4-cyclodiphosphate synthase [Curtobacterium pusillum]NUU13626.1 2-C-methyl-D-erythritol 2,4-cyclodiphosphate synthase [Curtobacterium pusillum]GLK32214.1 bifunctional enzyme IspD/IspF [Curtobacterium pusillum]
MDRAVVVVAAGSGTRLGIGTAKAFVPVAGSLMLERALAPLFTLPSPALVVVVAPATHLDECRALVASVAGAAVAYTAVVPGGADRHASVEAGLAVLPDSVTAVLVHDAARCLTPAAQFGRVFDAVLAGAGAGFVPALPVTDTIKRVDGDVVVETVDRAALVGVQTPQGFPLAALRQAYAASSRSETDDAGVFQAAGGTVRFVAGDADAFKITTPWDLGRAESIVRARSAVPDTVRVGFGVDVHAFDAAAPCRVGLLDFPGEAGLSGHSDGDAVAHAVCDALLSAGALGDIGGRFGTSDPAYAGAAGDVFVRGAVEALAGAGLEPVSVTVQVIGNRPRIGARRTEMQDALAAVVGAPVAVSGTTTDGLGFTGRGEGLAAIATAVVRPA